MKRVLLFSILSFYLSIYCFSQQESVLNWDKKVHDFGTVNSQKQEVVSIAFHFDVIGDAPIVIHDVEATCGCTSSEWTRQAIRPNEKGQVQVFVNIKTLKGYFDKRLFVKTNSTNNVELLRVKVFVN